jgi:glycosyltransferase 2 family protein
VESAVGRAKGVERKSAWGRLLAKLAVSAVLLWLPLHHIPLGTVLAQIMAMNWADVIGALIALSASTAVAAIRWSVILRTLGTPRSPRITYPLSLIGLFFGQALPAGLGGDAVRAWLACRTGIPASVAISSVLADRLTGLFAILLIVTFELPALHVVFSGTAVFNGLLGMLLASYAAYAVVMSLDRLPQSLHRFRVVRGFARVSADLRQTLLTPRAAIPVLACGIVVQIGNVLAIIFLTGNFHLTGMLLAATLIVPLSNILQSLPISIAGWGIRESFFVSAYGVFGVGAPQAVAVSVVFGLLIVVSSLPGGILWLIQGGGSPQAIADGP